MILRSFSLDHLIPDPIERGIREMNKRKEEGNIQGMLMSRHQTKSRSFKCSSSLFSFPAASTTHNTPKTMEASPTERQETTARIYDRFFTYHPLLEYVGAVLLWFVVAQERKREGDKEKE